MTAIEKQVEQLPPADRLRLVEHILTTLDRPDAEIDAAWAKESERRLEAYRTRSNEPFAAAVSRRIAEIGLTDEDWQELNSSLEAVRHSRRDSIHRWIDFDASDFGH